MKLDKININGKKDTIEVLDKISFKRPIEKRRNLDLVAILSDN